MRIGLCGAPGSGKTVLGTMLYLTALSKGFPKTFLVHEYAQERIVSGKTISTIEEQVTTTFVQFGRERDAPSGFNNIICDSALFLGEIYMEYNKLYKTDRQDLVEKIRVTTGLCNYDVVLFVPPIPGMMIDSSVRLHSNEDSNKLSEVMWNYCKDKGFNTIVVSECVSERQGFCDRFVNDYFVN